MSLLMTLAGKRPSMTNFIDSGTRNHVSPFAAISMDSGRSIAVATAFNAP